MSLFVVTYIHPDADRWEQHVSAHVAWLVARLKDGTLRASGPFVGTAEKSALLILQAASRKDVEDIVATDPFVTEGLVTNMTVSEWNPIFGDYNAHSTHAGASLPQTP